MKTISYTLHLLFYSLSLPSFLFLPVFLFILFVIFLSFSSLPSFHFPFPYLPLYALSILFSSTFLFPFPPYPLYVFLSSLLFLFPLFSSPCPSCPFLLSLSSFPLSPELPIYFISSSLTAHSSTFLLSIYSFLIPHRSPSPPSPPTPSPPTPTTLPFHTVISHAYSVLLYLPLIFSGNISYLLLIVPMFTLDKYIHILHSFQVYTVYMYIYLYIRVQLKTTVGKNLQPSQAIIAQDS